MNRVLVAGLGNIFLSDDGFGVEVARQLAGQSLPDGVEVVDIGIRGVHLAYQLLDGYDLVVLIDAVQRGGAPGTLYVIEHHDAQDQAAGDGTQMLDAHDLDPDKVLDTARALGAPPTRTVVLGCEPLSVEAGMGLSEPVAGSVEAAARLALELLGEPAGIGGDPTLCA